MKKLQDFKEGKEIFLMQGVEKVKKFLKQKNGVIFA